MSQVAVKKTNANLFDKIMDGLSIRHQYVQIELANYLFMP